MNNFDSIAPYYDGLSKLVFGATIQTSQEAFISKILPNSNVLILGGGTGQITLSILEQSENVGITYIEKSKKMIEIAKVKLSAKQLSQVEFIELPFNDYRIEREFDVIVANFFLDVFPKEELLASIDKIKSLLSPSGILLVSDFQINDSLISKVWQKPLLWMMHFFFGYVTQLESHRLQDINQAIGQGGFTIEKEEMFFGKVIFSRLYK